MRIFVQAVTTGSLSGAARWLGVSPAMAARHVDALEARLGIKLLHRTTRRLHLTEAGATYLDACRRILAEIDEVEADVASRRIEASGLLRVNIPLSFGTRFISPLLPAFMRRHPALSVELGLSDTQVDLLEGGWDLAIRIGRLGDSPLRARKLGECKMLVCAAPAYLHRHGTPQRVSDLSQHNCLGYTLSTSVGPQEWAFGPEGEVRVPIAGNITANNGEALLTMAVGGLGIIYQPEFIVADALNRGKLESIGLDLASIDTGGIHALYPSQRRPPAKVRVMIDYLLEVFANAPNAW
ncbi:LysR family transcriptional regulator [Modicisalibacter ilicicola]|nr:LysR family transcriptional regulator [Halomonas ilicicola]